MLISIPLTTWLFWAEYKGTHFMPKRKKISLFQPKEGLRSKLHKMVVVQHPNLFIGVTKRDSHFLTNIVKLIFETLSKVSSEAEGGRPLSVASHNLTCLCQKSYPASG